MKRTPRTTGLRLLLLRRLLAFGREDRGQVLPIAAVMLMGFLGMAAVSIDMGHAMLNYEQLQNAADAAAMAGAQSLPSTSASTVATQYSAVESQYNAQAMTAGATMVTGYPKLLCLNTLKTQGMACSSPANANAVQVKLQMSTHMTFAALARFGYPTLTVAATSTAAMRGASPTPYNVAIILDTTLSMGEYDSNCGATQLACALNGVQVLLQSLTPCAANLTTCPSDTGSSSNTVDHVALFSFPNVTVGTAALDYQCTTSMPSSYVVGKTTYHSLYSSSWGYYTQQYNNAQPYADLPTAITYSFPSSTATSYAPSGSSTATYQITPFLNDYKTSANATSLNTSSILVKAAGAVSNCGGMTLPNYDGDFGTYYAGAIYAAQAALTAEKAAYPGSQNVIILLSDGDATAPNYLNIYNTKYYAMTTPATSNGTYPSWVNECSQGITAAKAATAAGTRVYTVAYGSPTSGCSTDTSGTYAGISPCTAMQDMASASQYFYSDYNQSGSKSTCYSSSQSVTKLADIFSAIAGDLTVARLIPNNTT